MDECPDRSAAVMRPAPAKINLALHVTGRRPHGSREGGYHDLDTLAVFADCGEKISVFPGDELTLELHGSFAAHAPADRTNLALAAASRLRKAAGITAGAAIRLEKHLPVGAGLGGGSADAAAALNALNIFWKAGLDDRKLTELAACLGADVPMCVYSRALRASGVGEVIEHLPAVPHLPLVLVWPGRPVSTVSVFKRLRNVSNPPLPDLSGSHPTVEAVVDYLAGTRNDLQAAAIGIEPAIGGVLEALAATNQCLFSRMSGSGSACFGLYPSKAEADAAGSLIGAARPGWWVRAVEAR